MTENRMSLRETDDLQYLTADLFTAAGGVSHGFTTRRGGVSEGIYASLNLGVNRGDDPAAVCENYSRTCAALEMDPGRLVFSRQVHGDAVRSATSADAGKGLSRPIDYEADGLITNEPELPLVIFTADCIPILLYDPKARCVGAVHSGWRGTALGIVSRAVSRMVSEYGASPSSLLAVIGPGICPDCYETDGDVPRAMRDALGEDASPFLRERASGKWQVDLKGLNALHLLRANVPTENITVSGECTSCRSSQYWSHRVTKGQRGSQAALIQLLRPGTQRTKS